MQYDEMGRVTSRTGPEGATTTEYYGAGSASINQAKKVAGFAGNVSGYAYDGNGYLTSIQNSTNSVTLYSSGTQNGLGQPLTYSLGNGKTSTNTFVNNMPTHYATPGVQDLTLTWDYASGNLQSRQDVIKNKIESFTYDNPNWLRVRL